MHGISNRLYLVTPEWFKDSALHLKRLPESRYVHETTSHPLPVHATTTESMAHASSASSPFDGLALLAHAADTIETKQDARNNCDRS
jgi:hypothetical protein